MRITDSDPGGQLNKDPDKNKSARYPYLTFNIGLLSPESLRKAQAGLIRIESAQSASRRHPAVQLHEELPVPQAGVRPQVKQVLNVEGLAERPGGLAQAHRVQEGGGSGQLPHQPHLGAGLAIKNPTQKNPQKTPKKHTKIVFFFFFFFKFKIFNENNNTNFSP
jgi:hypothetical protein